MEGSFRITPLGAAVVEAMPDRKAVAAVKRKFRRTGECPTSAIFPTEGRVVGFYAELVATKAGEGDNSDKD